MPKTRKIDANTMGGRLRAGRIAKNLTLEGIGKHLGVSAQAVSQWEYGEAMPAVDKLCVLVRLLGLGIDDVLGMRSSGRSALDAISEHLERVLEVLPTAEPMIIDTSVNRAIADDVYLVRLRKGDRTAVLGRVVWPKI